MPSHLRDKEDGFSLSIRKCQIAGSLVVLE